VESRQDLKLIICLLKIVLVKVIDGGMGTELVRCGVEDVDKHKLWSALANVDFPDSVVQGKNL